MFKLKVNKSQAGKLDETNLANTFYFTHLYVYFQTYCYLYIGKVYYK